MGLMDMSIHRDDRLPDVGVELRELFPRNAGRYFVGPACRVSDNVGPTAVLV